MTDILKEFSEDALIRAIHKSWNTCMLKLFAGNPETYYMETPQLKIIDNSLKIAMFNRILNTNMSSRELEPKISEITEHFDSRELPFTWQVDPWDEPLELGDKLEAAGFELDETPGMAVKIDELKPPKILDGYKWKRVETMEELHEWSYLCARAYGMPEFGWDFLANACINMGVVDDYHCYTGYYNGIPTSTSSLLYSDGVAGLYCVANLPEYRGKGFGSVISYVPFLDAGERGYEVGILHSSNMGYNVYRRLGFEDICRLHRYQWNPSQ